MVNAVFEASVARNKARNLPPHCEERIDEVLWDWACNHAELDIAKVKAELRHLFQSQADWHEQEMKDIRYRINHGMES